jgi:hypothetical protein
LKPWSYWAACAPIAAARIATSSNGIAHSLFCGLTWGMATAWNSNYVGVGAAKLDATAKCWIGNWI